MLKHSIQTKICNCQTPSNKKIFHSNIHHSFCEKCGSILIKSLNGHIHYTIKPNKKQKDIELDPIILIKSMKKKTEENYPYIYNIYNNSDKHNNFGNFEKLNTYLKNRKMLLIKLQQLIKTFDYCDDTFYQCLFYLDTYLSKDINEEMSKKKILYNLIGYFLCSAKLGEKDIFEPPFESFFNLANGIYLSPNKIGQYEEFCLERINYNIFSYSAYDWLTHLISNGIIFNNEINDSNEIIIINGHRHTLVNTVNKYSMSLLLQLTSSNIFFKYSPMYMAFSIIQLAREKYIDNSMIKTKLFHKLIDLYGVNYSDFKECYEEIKSEINLENKENSKDNKYIEENKTNQNTTKNLKKFSVDKIKKYKKKNIYIPTEIVKNEEVSSFHDDIEQNQNEISDYNRDLFLSRNKRSLTKANHVSIDCRLNSKDYIPITNLKHQNNKNELSTIKTKKNTYFHSNTKNNRITFNIDSGKEKEEDKQENKINKKQKKLLTSIKLPSVYLDENINHKNNQLEQNQKTIYIDKPKKYKIKSNKDLDKYNFYILVDKEQA